jgi:hypothetical protein
MNLRAESTTYDRALSQLETAGQQLLDTGIVLLEYPKINWPPSHTPWTDPAWSTARTEYRKSFLPINNAIVRATIKRVARELKRPVIVAEKDYFGNPDGRIRVTIKRAKKRAPLVAQFMLLDYSSVPISFRKDGTNWYLWFVGYKGVRAFKNWVEFCRIDPDCRSALMLPPLAPDLQLAA